MADHAQRIIGISLISGMLVIGILVMAFSGSGEAEEQKVAANSQKSPVTKPASKTKKVSSKTATTRTASNDRFEPDTRIRKTTSRRNLVGPPSKRFSSR